MKIQTQSLGEQNIAKEQIITFPAGLIGFEHLHSYALLDSPHPPFTILQSTEESALAFILVNPYLVREDFVLEVADDDLTTIRFKKEADVLVFSIVTIPKDEPEKISCNLLGPIIINRKERIACQAISLGKEWSTKHYILEKIHTTQEVGDYAYSQP